MPSQKTLRADGTRPRVDGSGDHARAPWVEQVEGDHQKELHENTASVPSAWSVVRAWLFRADITGLSGWCLEAGHYHPREQPPLHAHHERRRRCRQRDLVR